VTGNTARPFWDRAVGWPSAACRAVPFLLTGLLTAGLLPIVAAAEPPARKVPSDSATDVNPYADHIADAARRFGLPAPWICAVMRAESGGDRHAVSPAGAMGLMQIMPATWAALRAHYGLGDDPFDPRDNILAGTAYLRELHDRFGAPGFLAAYNAGPSRYADHLATGRPLPAETRAFVTALAPAMTVAGTVEVQAREAVSHGGWTQAPLFIARDRNSATAVSAQADAPSESKTTARKTHALDAVTPHASGLFVAIPDREKQR
jgi:soluble lytic murein transglycosylase-like protein